MEVKERVFIVAVPRSGTTLMQSLLACHPQIETFPESHFFSCLISKGDWHQKPWRKLLSVLGIALPKGKIKFSDFLDLIGQANMKQYLPKTALFSRQYALVFTEVLDKITEQKGKSVWLEKSSEHLYHIQNIEKWVNSAKFIHVIRNGTDVVSSLYDVTRKYDWGEPLGIDQCIHSWIRGIKTSSRHLHKHNHILVRYELLVEDPKSVLTEICEFLGLSFEEVMLLERNTTAKKLIKNTELWKKTSVSEPIRNANDSKFYELFDEEQRRYILSQLSEICIDDLSPRKKKGIVKSTL